MITEHQHTQPRSIDEETRRLERHVLADPLKEMLVHRRCSCLAAAEAHLCEQQRHGISTGLASSQSSSRRATQALSRKATQARRLAEAHLCEEDPSERQVGAQIHVPEGAVQRVDERLGEAKPDACELVRWQSWVPDGDWEQEAKGPDGSPGHHNDAITKGDLAVGQQRGGRRQAGAEQGVERKDCEAEARAHAVGAEPEVACDDPEHYK